MDELNQLLQGLPNAEMLTTPQKQRALNLAVIPDTWGRYPGEMGYVTTTDVYYAALLLLSFLKAQPVVTSASSEGTSVAATAPDWSGLESYYRSMSVIIAAQGNQVLQVVPIPEPAHVVRTDMSGGDQRYGDINTDLG